VKRKAIRHLGPGKRRAAMRKLRAIPSEKRAAASRENGKQNKGGGRPPGPQPWKALGISRQWWYDKRRKG
jgi:hypothetical protein